MQAPKKTVDRELESLEEFLLEQVFFHQDLLQTEVLATSFVTLVERERKD